MNAISLLSRVPVVLAALLMGTALASSGPAAAQDAVSVLERASERYQALDGLCADFQQELRVALLRRTTESRGELCQSPPGRFEMRFTEPAGDRIVSDGTHLWIFFPSADPGQAVRTRLAGVEGRFDFHREFLHDPGERYRSSLEGTEEIGGRRAHRILLEPRDPSPYVRIRVWIDAESHLLRKLEIHEDTDTVRILDLTNIRLNPDLPADRFRFDPPEGVRVITRERLP